MDRRYTILTLVGSLRRDSYTRKVMQAMTALAPPSLEFRDVDLSALPMYNADLEAALPESWAALRRDVRACDGVLFFTPEYNRSVPAAIKNAIDVASRPSGQNAWNGKPAGVVSVTTGGLGAFGANHHLRQSLVFINVLAMAQPEAYVARVADLFDEHGALVNDGTRQFFTTFMAAFGAWVTRLS